MFAWALAHTSSLTCLPRRNDAEVWPCGECHSLPAKGGRSEESSLCICNSAVTLLSWSGHHLIVYNIILSCSLCRYIYMIYVYSFMLHTYMICYIMHYIYIYIVTYIVLYTCILYNIHTPTCMM